MPMKTDYEFYRFTPCNNILLFENFSAWDERVTKDILKNAMQVRKKYFHDEPYAILADYRDWALQTPESEKIVSYELSRNPDRNLTHYAAVVGDSQLKRWQLSNIFKNVETYPIQFFETMDEAINWLISFGYHLDQKNLEKKLA